MTDKQIKHWAQEVWNKFRIDELYKTLEDFREEIRKEYVQTWKPK
jgi:hypothetical protein